MIKVEVNNVVTGKQYGARFEDIDQANLWIDNQVNKGSWGLPARAVHEDDMNEIVKTRVLTKEKDADDKWVCNVKADYEISIYQDSVYKEKRQKEYPSWDQVMEAMVENMEMRPEQLNAIKAQRAAIRAKYPKDTKELLERR